MIKGNYSCHVWMELNVIRRTYFWITIIQRPHPQWNSWAEGVELNHHGEFVVSSYIPTRNSSLPLRVSVSKRISWSISIVSAWVGSHVHASRIKNMKKEIWFNPMKTTLTESMLCPDIIGFYSIPYKNLVSYE